MTQWVYRLEQREKNQEVEEESRLEQAELYLKLNIKDRNYLNLIDTSLLLNCNLIKALSLELADNIFRIELVLILSVKNGLRDSFTMKA